MIMHISDKFRELQLRDRDSWVLDHAWRSTDPLCPVAGHQQCGASRNLFGVSKNISVSLWGYDIIRDSKGTLFVCRMGIVAPSPDKEEELSCHISYVLF